MFISVNGKAKEVSEIFCGGSDGKAHLVNEVFGSVNGVAKRIYLNREPNAFDRFSWAEIKQLAIDGLLLEHFNIGDEVVIPFKEPISNKVSGYQNGTATSLSTTLYQSAITMKIKSLTEGSMVLYPKYGTILYGSYGINNSEYGKSQSSWSLSDYEAHAPYWSFSEIGKCTFKMDEVMPDDLREVATKYKVLSRLQANSNYVGGYYKEYKTTCICQYTGSLGTLTTGKVQIEDENGNILEKEMVTSNNFYYTIDDIKKLWIPPENGYFGNKQNQFKLSPMIYYSGSYNDYGVSRKGVYMYPFNTPWEYDIAEDGEVLSKPASRGATNPIYVASMFLPMIIINDSTNS